MNPTTGVSIRYQVEKHQLIYNAYGFELRTKNGHASYNRQPGDICGWHYGTLDVEQPAPTENAF